MRKILLLSVCALALAVSAVPAHACSACRDDTAGGAPAFRKAMRIAIPVLGIPAALLFAGMLVAAGKND